MKHELTCADAEALGFPERYAAGTLDDDAVERFESHFVACARCQESLALAAAVRRGADAPHRRVRGYVGPAATLLVAAVAFFALLHVRANAALRALGRMDAPPAYGGVAVRAAPTPDDSLFAAAMSDYAAGRYAAAITGLRAMRANGAPAPPVSFFLGSALLMQGQPAAADSAFTRVISAAPNPYVADAHYYRALALLQTDRAAAAELELRAAISGGGATAARADELLRRLEARRAP